MTSTIAGTFNFRDLGGIPLSSGGATVAGILYRSDALSGLTAEGLDQLAASDIGVIVDFRTPQEQQLAPDRLPTSRPFRVVDLPLLQGALSGLVDPLTSSTPDDDPSAKAKKMDAALAKLPSLGDLYVGMLQHGAASFAELARHVSAATADPPTAVLFHCTAGKDRTGVGAALLLDAVGAERSAVVADYSSSQDHLSGAWADAMFEMVKQAGVPLTDTLRELIAETPASAIEQAFAWLDPQGGSAAYLQSGGLTDAELDSLTGRLTR